MELADVLVLHMTWFCCYDRKRKKTEEPLSDDEDHGDFDPQQLREHEEFTKVKNIDVIQLGMHEMDTWYFSPLPPEYKDCKVSSVLGM